MKSNCLVALEKFTFTKYFHLSLEFNRTYPHAFTVYKNPFFLFYSFGS